MNKEKTFYSAHFGEIFSIQELSDASQVQTKIGKQFDINEQSQIILTEDGKAFTPEIYAIHKKFYCFDKETFTKKKQYISGDFALPQLTPCEQAGASGSLSFLDIDFKEKLLREVLRSATHTAQQMESTIKKFNSIMGKIRVIFECTKVLTSCDYGFSDIEDLIKFIQTKTNNIEEYIQNFPDVKKKLRNVEIHQKLRKGNVKTLFDVAFPDPSKVETFLNAGESSCQSIKILLEKKKDSYQTLINIRGKLGKFEDDFIRELQKLQLPLKRIEEIQSQVIKTCTFCDEIIKSNVGHIPSADPIIQQGSNVSEALKNANAIIQTANECFQSVLTLISQYYDAISSIYTKLEQFQEDYSLLKVIKEHQLKYLFSMISFRLLSESYSQFIHELKRRNAFKLFVYHQTTTLNQQIQHVFKEELQRRNEFLQHNEASLLSSYFPCLNEKLLSFHLDFTHLDASLPDLFVSEMKDLLLTHLNNQNYDDFIDNQEIRDLLRSFTPFICIDNHNNNNNNNSDHHHRDDDDTIAMLKLQIERQNEEIQILQTSLLESSKLKDEVIAQHSKISELKIEIEGLKQKEAKLQLQVTDLHSLNDTLCSSNDELRKQNAEIEAKNVNLQNECDALRVKIEAKSDVQPRFDALLSLKEKIDRLHERYILQEEIKNVRNIGFGNENGELEMQITDYIQQLMGNVISMKADKDDLALQVVGLAEQNSDLLRIAKAEKEKMPIILELQEELLNYKNLIANIQKEKTTLQVEIESLSSKLDEYQREELKFAQLLENDNEDNIPILERALTSMANFKNVERNIEMLKNDFARKHIVLENFKDGDLVFLYKKRPNIYEVFNSNSPHYYLSLTDIEEQNLDKRKDNIFLAEILCFFECKTDENNPYLLGPNIPVYHIVYAKILDDYPLLKQFNN